MDIEKVKACYEATADVYAYKFAGELQYKHLDRILLREFAAENKTKGRIADLGCGPGHTTRFLHEQGLTDLTGIDLSPAMIGKAKELHPELSFEVGNILQLPFADGSFAGIIAFYAIVHFTYEQLVQALKQVHRLLAGQGQFLFAFHIGKEHIHLTEFLEKEVEISFYFFEVQVIKELLAESGFRLIDAIERHPYPGVEFQSRRAYLWAEKI